MQLEKCCRMVRLFEKTKTRQRGIADLPAIRNRPQQQLSATGGLQYNIGIPGIKEGPQLTLNFRNNDARTLYLACLHKVYSKSK